MTDKPCDYHQVGQVGRNKIIVREHEKRGILPKQCTEMLLIVSYGRLNDNQILTLFV